MKVINIFKDGNKGLETHLDIRGIIVDIFYHTEINHVALIRSEPCVVRGNHYHRETTQYMLMTKGSLEYWYKPLNSNKKPKMYLCKVGDLVTTPRNEVHTLRITEEGNEFIVFSRGKRGGRDYESDTIRVKPII